MWLADQRRTWANKHAQTQLLTPIPGLGCSNLNLIRWSPVASDGNPQSRFFLSRPIFQDVSGLAVKFFIQKDLPEQLQAELCETIASLGGRVEQKVPRSGYILVQQGTAEEERLRLCWTSKQRPERYFVPYTFVEACKIAGMLLKQIFVENGEPIKMHIHSSIANVNARAALSARIMHSGGDPTASIQSAKVILADPNTDIFAHLVNSFQQMQDKYVENYLWVKKCIDRGQVLYTPMVYKNPGGRRAGEERIQFNEEDEEHLCQWIAMKIPYKETGGRTGNRLYQQLVEMGNEPEYHWVNRHTWQSWRERYKKNSARLDQRISFIVQERKPLVGEKGQYAFVRQPEEKPKRTRKKTAKVEDQPHQPFDPELGQQPGPSHFQQGAVDDHHAQLMQGAYIPPAMPYPYPPPPMAFPIGGPMDPSTPRKPAEREEVEDPDDSAEWQIREGNEPPPAWAKRKAEEEEAEPNKRPRTGAVEVPYAAILAGLAVADPQTLASMHMMDRELYSIARDHRFTLEEVQEYFNKTGDLERTRERFRRMREQLSRFIEEEDAQAGVAQITQAQPALPVQQGLALPPASAEGQPEEGPRPDPGLSQGVSSTTLPSEGSQLNNAA
ncbi:hypothetical protein PUNSTDRAFT_117254 [Punctularia strigosozonata HHB-11173 SS5]|uniref:uncharacterized protein n=1 Tax=Punctularia strigosozonata (strain HHB-11173) TaxID=741275 RepID=UPI0004416C63|nr:uncharacterized protein PUNSTDRAFT_117254 [Punctularia strigosozonata HHB-11173 SS5]EIN13496.1 hypothetical protein PUNSTDRAFT_117254 [Punctularia strigosozonata HHB-11173 SS5]